ncbi:MAG: guanylate kinase [Candidatus Omnitrophica bacterium]|nr:guanylate kinase [Candidatus Omnitrophota bacterium]MCM8771379.1 guanylate kinase [Candidatus Omnitrophota bacterium]
MGKNLIFVISGPSGSGKTTLVKKLFQDRFLKKVLARPISFTTRPRRKGEKDKRDYFFLKPEEFLRLRQAKKFLEWTRYLGYDYATSKDEISRQLNEGRHLVLCVDQRGAFKIKKLFPKNTRLVFIQPPDLKTLEERIRLRARGDKNKNECEINQRLAGARKELKYRHKYDWCIVNKRLDTALKRLKEIIQKEIR